MKILSGFCDYLCFGCETGTKETLLETARALLSPEFSDALRLQLDKGLSFPTARQAALAEKSTLLQNPNDILGVEYCKAILSQGSPMEILPIKRQGSYHDTEADKENPSATAVRALITSAHDWKSCIPQKGIEGSNPSFSAMKHPDERNRLSGLFATVAQSVEQLIRNQQVAGSSPASSSKQKGQALGLTLFIMLQDNAQGSCYRLHSYSFAVPFKAEMLCPANIFV